MKRKLGGLLLCVSLACTVQAWALPDSCGEENVHFKVTTQIYSPPDPTPVAGKAQIIFLVTEHTNEYAMDVGEIRLGLDGVWIGATKGNSRFIYSVEPGLHHLCANWPSTLSSEWQRTRLDLLNVEPDKVYYFQIKITKLSKDKIITNGTELVVNSLDLMLVNVDEGKYLAKFLSLSTSTPKK
jgi:hypothetical protein